MAPIRPLNTMAGSGATTDGSTIPLATVAATASEMNAPAKLSSEAMPIATRGGSARVDIAVATTFAVSWKPFVKSKARAVPTTSTSSRSLCIRGRSRVLDHDALEDVRHPLCRVDRVLEPLVDVLPADDHHWVDPGVEQRRDRLSGDAVAVVLE